MVSLVSRSALLLGFALCLWLPGCGNGSKSVGFDAQSENFCDADTPCPTTGRPFCDLEGSLPASMGIPNSCIPDPVTAECVDSEDCLDEEAAHCTSMGTCVACLNFSHCNAIDPVCSLSEQRCTSCRQGNEGNNVCGAIDPLQPFCGIQGSCVACLDNTQCSVVTAPICNTDGACQGCESDEQCPSESCNLVSGACQ